MPFRLTNAPTMFQAYINRALTSLINIYYIIYLDDILIYSDLREEHVEHLRLVLERLRKYALYASRKKCKFFTDYLKFLRFIITIEGVSIDRSKLLIVEEQLIPKTLKEVQSFLGFANFYRRFIKRYLKVAGPLTTLTKGIKEGKGGSFKQSDN